MQRNDPADAGHGFTFPPTVIVVHNKEHRAKCSVEPLRGQPSFEFLTYPLKQAFHESNYVRLAMDGPLLSHADSQRGLLVLDATWRLAAKMEKQFCHIEPRSLPHWETAYPRVSKFNYDPNGGLATIEAIFIAYHLLGRGTDGLLDSYYWRDIFLQRNSAHLNMT